MKKSDKEKCHLKYYTTASFLESAPQLWNDRCEDVKMRGLFRSNYCFNWQIIGVNEEISRISFSSGNI